MTTKLFSKNALWLIFFLLTSVSAFAYSWGGPSSIPVGTQYYVCVGGESDEYLVLYKNGSYFASGYGNVGASTTDTSAGTVYYTVYGDYGSDTMEVEATAVNFPPVAGISVDGHSSGTSLTRPLFGDLTITVRFSATDTNGNLSGIRYNVWNATTQVHDNGNGVFQPVSGSSAEYVKTVTLNTDGEWYFWSDVQDVPGAATGAYSNTPPWREGFKITVGPPANQIPSGWIDGLSTPNVTFGQTAYGSGWAADYEMGAPVSSVKIYVDGNYVSDGVFNLARPDVQYANINGMNLSKKDITNSGFNFAIPTAGLCLGTHTVTALATDDAGATSWLQLLNNNYFTVSATPTTFTIAPTTFTYNGSSQGPTITPSPSGATYTPGGTPTAIDAGTYSVTATATGNYSGGPVEAFWTINKAEQAAVVLTPGSNQTIPVGSSITFTASGGSGTGDYEWLGAASGTEPSTTVTFSSIGEFSVSVRRNGNKNYLDSDPAGPVTITVIAIPTTFTIAPTVFTYNGSTQGPTITPNPSSATYKLDGTPTAIDAGTYSVSATATGNYSGGPVQVLWTINKADQAGVVMTPGSNQTIHVGSSITFTASGGSGIGDYEWLGAASGTGPSKAVIFSSIGNTSVGVRRKGDNNYFQSDDAPPVPVTVVAIPTEFNIAPTAFTYNGGSQGPTITPTPVEATYTPSGTPAAVDAGNYTVSATANGNYSGSKGPVSWEILKAGPVISWQTPSPIEFGTPLSSTQLNATANVPGAFTYTPSAGTLLPVGTHILTAQFQPNDATNYSPVPSQVNLVVYRDSHAPSVPSGLVLQSNAHNSVSISWNASSDNIGVDHYNVYRNGSLRASALGNSFSDGGVVGSTSYSYTVSAVDAEGNESAQSSPLDVTTPAAPDTQAPSIPDGLNQGAVTYNGAAFSWIASTDNVGVSHYRVYRNGALLGTAGSTNYSDTTVAASATYSYTVSAVDAESNASAQSSSLSITTPAAPPPPDGQAPFASGVPTVSSIGKTFVVFSWPAYQDNVGVIGYEVKLNGSTVMSTSLLTASLNELQPNTGYDLSVRARDAAGNWSSWSAGLNVTTLSLVPSEDDDNDGVSNEIEMKLGLNPLNASDVHVEQPLYDTTNQLQGGTTGTYNKDAEGNIKEVRR